RQSARARRDHLRPRPISTSNASDAIGRRGPGSLVHAQSLVFAALSTAWVAGTGAGAASVAVFGTTSTGGGASRLAVDATPICSPERTVPTLPRAAPRATEVSSRATFGCVFPPSGGPPQRPRIGFSHSSSPVHSWRIAYLP